MTTQGYEDDFDIDDGSSWNEYEAFTMRRGPQQPANCMAQQMTRKVAPSYDGKTRFLAFQDAIDDWCDITELEPEKCGPALRNRFEEPNLFTSVC